MKKFLIGFMVFVLVLFIVPAAVYADPGVEPVAIGDSTAEWTDEEAKFGDYSVKLSMRGGWWDWPNNNAEVQIGITGSPKISEVDSWSYWTISPDKYTVPIELNLDTTGDGGIDKVLYATVAGDTPEGWFEVNQDTGHWWYGAGSPDNWAELQSWVNERYPDATLPRVDLGYGPLGSNQAIDAYVDDFTLNGNIYAVEPEEEEPKPEPVEEEKVVIRRIHPMTCYQVYVNDDGHFEFVFWYEYANNNWVSIYDVEGNLVYIVDFPYGNPVVVVDLPDGMYVVKTFHSEGEILQEFVIGK